MKNILFTLALLVSFSFLSHSQRAILAKTQNGVFGPTVYYESGEIQEEGMSVDGRKQGEEIGYYESGTVKYKVNYVDGISRGERIAYYKSGEVEWKGYECGFPEFAIHLMSHDGYGDYERYITPIDERSNINYGSYFNSDDFEILKENIDTVSNKSVLKKENNIFQFEFYNSDNLNVYENPENLKSFIAQLDNKYIEKTDEYLKVINTKGRKKSHYEYNVNFYKETLFHYGNLGSYYELNYFNVGDKEILSMSDSKHELFKGGSLKSSSGCDDNKLINLTMIMVNFLKVWKDSLKS